MLASPARPTRASRWLRRGRLKGAKTPFCSCGDPVVLVDQTAETISSFDGSAGRWWLRFERHRRTEAQCAVRALMVVVLNEAAQDAHEVARPEDQQPVEALRADGSHEPLCVSICARRLKRREDHAGPVGSEHLTEFRGELSRPGRG